MNECFLLQFSFSSSSCSSLAPSTTSPFAWATSKVRRTAPEPNHDRAAPIHWRSAWLPQEHNDHTVDRKTNDQKRKAQSHKVLMEFNPLHPECAKRLFYLSVQSMPARLRNKMKFLWSQAFYCHVYIDIYIYIQIITYIYIYISKCICMLRKQWNICMCIRIIFCVHM